MRLGSIRFGERLSRRERLRLVRFGFGERGRKVSDNEVIEESERGEKGFCRNNGGSEKLVSAIILAEREKEFWLKKT